MDAVILCGGRGTRVETITGGKYPKILIPVNGRPFIEYLIDNLYSLGIRRFIFAAGYQGEVIRAYLRAREVFGGILNDRVRLDVVIESEPLDTGGAILNVLNKPTCHPDGNIFLVGNGDSLILPEKGVDCYEELYYDEPLWGKPACAMFTCYTHHQGQYDTMEIDYEDWIKKIEPGQPGKPTSSFINCGWYIFRREFFKDYPETKKSSLERDMFPAYLDEQLIKPIIVGKEQFMEIGTPEALEDVSRRLK